MILCDIGNTHYHILQSSKIHNIPLNKSIDILKGEKVYFISVNEDATQKLQLVAKESINLKAYADVNSAYKGLGVDRAVACSAIDVGVVVDAGTAITVDVVHDNNHLGGYILPGLGSYKRLFSKISDILDKDTNFAVDIKALPQNTRDAISYGVLNPIILSIQAVAKENKIYFTGGDGKYLSKYFDKAIYDEQLVFRGMREIIKREGI
jgi:type III pantothenate kinase